MVYPRASIRKEAIYSATTNYLFPEIRDLNPDIFEEVISVLPILIFLGFVAGLGTGYKLVHKKTVPLVRFVAETDKEKTLQEHGIRLDQTTKCSICGDIITVDNIGAVVVNKSVQTFLCSKPQCMTVSDILRSASRETKANLR